MLKLMLEPEICGDYSEISFENMSLVRQEMPVESTDSPSRNSTGRGSFAINIPPCTMRKKSPPNPYRSKSEPLLRENPPLMMPYNIRDMLENFMRKPILFVDIISFDCSDDVILYAHVNILRQLEYFTKVIDDGIITPSFQKQSESGIICNMTSPALAIILARVKIEDTNDIFDLAEMKLSANDVIEMCHFTIDSNMIPLRNAIDNYIAHKPSSFLRDSSILNFISKLYVEDGLMRNSAKSLVQKLMDNRSRNAVKRELTPPSSDSVACEYSEQAAKVVACNANASEAIDFIAEWTGSRNSPSQLYNIIKHVSMKGQTLPTVEKFIKLISVIPSNQSDLIRVIYENEVIPSLLRLAK